MSRRLDIPTVPAKPALNKNKIYVAVFLSDGDNIQYDQGAMKIDRLWNSPERGSIPIGWTASPVMLDAGPQILNYYYRTATENDVLVCGPSGLGYSTAFEWPGEAFTKQYGKLTNDYFEKTAFNVITVWHELPSNKADWFTGAMPSLLGLTTQGLAGLRIRHSASGVPMIWMGAANITGIGGMAYEDGVDNIYKLLSGAAKLPQSSAQFYAAQGNVWGTSVSDFVRLRADLERAYPGRFEFVRPDHFMMLLNEADGKPYNAALRANAEASGGTGAANTVDGSFTTGWESSAAGEKWITLDLGESYVLDRYVLKNAETNYLDPSLNTKGWKLQYSADGEDWRDADTVTANSAAIAYRGLNGQKARYIRLLITEPSADGTARVQDLEVYGVKEKDTGFCAKVSGGWSSFWQSLTNRFFLIIDWFKRLFSN
jgi:hypothetical protein